MNVTYNGLADTQNLLTFSDVPNILKLEEEIYGEKAQIVFTFANGLNQFVTGDSQYYVSLFGETVTNTLDPSKAINKRFYISQSGQSTAASFANALNNCSSIAVDYNVIQKSNSVYVIAKTIGNKFGGRTDYLVKNIPTAQLTVTATDGSSYSNLLGSKIRVGVFQGLDTSVENYVTTLEKNWHGNFCAFDMSPVLATFSEYGINNYYVFDMSYVDRQGNYNWIGSQSGSTTIGYSANDSEKYLYNSGAKFLINTDENDYYKRILYTYTNRIPLSVLIGKTEAGYTWSFACRDSANNVITSGITSERKTTSEKSIFDKEIEIPHFEFYQSYYVDIAMGDLSAGYSNLIRFKVIKPLRATEYYQRVYWRNEYGGIQFFDFTGSRTENDSIDIETYEKNIFDYYDAEAYERKRIYKNDYSKEVTLASHLIEESGKWIFNSLAKSKKVWTEIDGKTYYIIPKSVEVNEDQNSNGIYRARLTYTYSEI